MNTIGRNDPCPCGSGKKYKHCCGAAAILSPYFKYDRIRQYDGEAVHLLARFVRQKYGADAINVAREEFFFFDVPSSSHEEEFFDRWFFFDWQPEETKRIAEIFLSEMGKTLKNGVLRFIEAAIHSPYSFYQVLDVNQGIGVTVRDILRRQEVRVIERTASNVLERGHIIFARIAEMDGISFFLVIGAQPFFPSYLENILELRSRLEKEGSLDNGAASDEILLRHEHLLRDAYFGLDYQIRKSKPSIRNADGDVLLFHILKYRIPSLMDAFYALKDLQQKRDHIADEELLEEAEKNDSSEILKIHLNWLKKSKMGDNSVFCSFVIEPTMLTVEANSEKRSKCVQKEIAKRLGEKAVLLKTEIVSTESMLQQADEKKLKAKEEDEQSRKLKEEPEMKAFMSAFMEKQWADWVDIPVPALRNMTPRKAAKDPIGRELLESLFMDFEMMNQKQKDELLKVDIAKLRHKLGL
jgi:hypothetical protein